MTFAGSAIGTYAIERVAIRAGIVDVPNARSSHHVPKPRAGGVALAVPFFAAVFFLGSHSFLPLRVELALIGGGSGLVVLGLIDDFRSLPASVRLLAHTLTAGFALFMLGGLPRVDFGLGPWDMGFAGNLMALIGLVWLINLTNFMDGTDGLAASEAVSTGLISGLLLWNAYPGLAAAWITLAASASAFLLFNWCPARIFMGDAGSGFLGYTFGVLMLAGSRQRPVSLWICLLMLGVFITDATITVIRRAVDGCRVWESHRTHAYQNAASRWGHAAVAAIVLLINCIWLAPLAYVAVLYPQLGLVLLACGIAPIALAVYLLGAGVSVSPLRPPRTQAGVSNSHEDSNYTKSTMLADDSSPHVDMPYSGVPPSN
ncbi:MAG: glycosyltransferase family 4 protein [Candidatus Korobacteraceae bacterium]|jgi:Fuc2NAc and GlcNAc transferase